MTVVRGHLQLRQQAWAEATSSYEAIDSGFENIERDLARLRAEDVMAVLQGADRGLPPWVQRHLADHPEYGRASALGDTLSAVGQDLDDADRLASEIATSLRETIALKRHRLLRTELFDQWIGVHRLALDVAQTQAELIGKEGREGRERARTHEAAIEGFRERLVRMQRRDAIGLGVRQARIDLDELCNGIWTLLESTGPIRNGGHHEDVTEIYAALSTVRARARDQLDALDGEAARAAGPISRQLAEHQETLGQLRAAHGHTVARSQAPRQVALDQGLQEVREILDDGIREARAGLADAAFAELQDMVDRRKDLQLERDELLEQLESIFAYARARL